MKEYDAYLFDADGTLFDTKGAILAAFEEMIRNLDLKEKPPRELILGTIGLPLVRQIREILGGGHSDELYERAGRIYNDALMADYRRTLSLFPGVKEGLEVLRDRGVKLAVVTSRRLPSLMAFLQATEIEGFFDLFVTPESTERHKPDPAPALFAARELGVAAEGCVFIGDASFDIECGKGAGMDAVLVKWSGGDSAEWAVKPDLEVDSFSELLPN